MGIRFYLPEDNAEVAGLLARCYGRADQALQLSQLRDKGNMRLEMVWLSDQKIRGYIGFVRLDSPAGWWGLTPFAVHPQHHKGAVAGDLIRIGLDQARQSRAKAVVALSDPAYFRPFGFSAKAAAHLSSPFAQTALSLYPIRPGMAGVTADLVFPAGFLTP